MDGDENDGYRTTEIGDLLRDRPGSLRDVSLLYGEEFYQAWGNSIETFRTGRTGFEKAYGRSSSAIWARTPMPPSASSGP